MTLFRSVWWSTAKRFRNCSHFAGRDIVDSAIFYSHTVSTICLPDNLRVCGCEITANKLERWKCWALGAPSLTSSIGRDKLAKFRFVLALLTCLVVHAFTHESQRWNKCLLCHQHLDKCAEPSSKGKAVDTRNWIASNQVFPFSWGWNIGCQKVWDRIHGQRWQVLPVGRG